MTRFGYVMLTYFAAMGVAAAAVIPTSLILVWNVSASAPIGFYRIEPAERLEIPDLVAVMPPEPLEDYMVARGYIGRDVPILKRVLGLPGQRVCRTGRTITVDGIAMGEALARDRRERPLPVWSGCRVVAADEIFLMNWQVPDSLDGRYFGPLPATTVIGRAIPLYTDEDGNGRFVWRAPTR
ncbi:S26 family signal peptidase [Chelativorans salis]|uniref:S26 family signal peptidase n=1 Tax=Chelativorans salis TaxID=2978478 RepID=A0ABT2LP49_9HYPH|nr:S26 family signal peptidase [Chelativorans sp. EGI FJ00035]MCT7376335.1 S26 family signal peptidase [Chelativorans sp. EGI FJ00035]